MPDATLRDVTAGTDSTVAADASKAASANAEAAAAAAAAAATAVNNTDAAEVGRILMESGFTKDNLNDLIAAPQALTNLRHLIENDPQEFLKTIERANPQLASRFHEKLADLYVERYDDKTGKAGGKAGNKDANADLMAEVADLRTKVTGFESAEQQRQNAAALAQTRSRYDGRVDDLFNQDAIKAMGLTKSERTAMRAQLNEQLASDPNVVKRVSNGNFVDVPHRFKAIIDEHVSDRKAATDAAKAARDGVQGRANQEFLGGPALLMPDASTPVFDSWDNTEDAFAKALTNAGR